jgi:hypothetical protein
MGADKADEGNSKLNTSSATIWFDTVHKTA